MKFKWWHHGTLGWRSDPETLNPEAVKDELEEGAFKVRRFDAALPVVGHTWVGDKAVVGFKPADEERIEGRILSRREYEAIGCNPFEVAETELGMERVEARHGEGSGTEPKKELQAGYLQAARWHFERLAPGERSKPYLSALPDGLRAEDFPHSRFRLERTKAERAPPPKGAASAWQWSEDTEEMSEEGLRTTGLPTELGTRESLERDGANKDREPEHVIRAGREDKTRRRTGQEFASGADERKRKPDGNERRERNEESEGIESWWSHRVVRNGVIVFAVVVVSVAASIGSTRIALRSDIEATAQNASRAAEVAQMAQTAATEVRLRAQAMTERRLAGQLEKAARKTVKGELRTALAGMLDEASSEGDTLADLAGKLTQRWAQDVGARAQGAIDGRITQWDVEIERKVDNEVKGAVEDQLRKSLAGMLGTRLAEGDTLEGLAERWVACIADRAQKLIEKNSNRNGGDAGGAGVTAMKRGQEQTGQEWAGKRTGGEAQGEGAGSGIHEASDSGSAPVIGDSRPRCARTHPGDMRCERRALTEPRCRNVQ